MAAESKHGKHAQEALPDEAPYEKIVERLEHVVARLERTDLPLEDSVHAFREGMDLLKRAEEKLRAAEKKVEELLDSGKSVPLSMDRGAEEAKPPPANRVAPAPDDDIPF